MKKYLYSLALASAVIGLNSCDSTQDEPHIQWYPVVTLEGDEVCYVEVGSDWTLPGFTAINTMTGEDATSKVEVLIYDVIAGDYVPSIDTSYPGMYNVEYNSYGSEVSTTPTVQKIREVYVYDPDVTDSIAGTWVLNMSESYELYEGEKYYFADDYGDVTSVVTISDVLPGFFNDGDLLCGLYSTVMNMDKNYASYLSQYGPNCFKLTGFLSMNTEGDITLLSWQRYSSFFNGFSVSNGKYDMETETISYNAALTWDPFGGAPQYYYVLEKY